MSENQASIPGEPEPLAAPSLPTASQPPTVPPVASPTSSGSEYRFPQAPPATSPPAAPTSSAAPTAPPAYPTSAYAPAAQAYPTTAQPYQTGPASYPTIAQPYPGASYPAPASQPYPGQPYPGQPYSGQPYSGQPYSGQPYSGQPYQGQPPFPPPGGPGGPQPGSTAVPRPSKRQAMLAVGALAVGLAGGVVGGYVGHSLQSNSSVTSPLQVPGGSGNGSAAPQLDRSSLSGIAAGLQPAIVHIANDEGEGSGVVIAADGLIVTNNHVVEGFHTVTVTFNSGQQVTGTVVGADQQTDIAVVKVDANNLVTAAWGDSDAVQIGDTVLAMGSPLGLQGSVTAGIISGLHRTITAGSSQQGDQGGGETIGDAIQTDAPINPGNSGGALVNMQGQVVGINTAIATAGSNGSIGVGFAISSNRAKAVAESIIAGQPVGHPFLGVKVSSAPGGGAKIESVDPGTAAAQAGIQAGDIVVKWGDRDIHTMEDLIGAIQASTVGQQVPVTVNRGGSSQSLTVTVGEQ